MKVGNVVWVRILDESAIILEKCDTRWHGRIHQQVNTWDVMFGDGTTSNEFETDLELIDENRRPSTDG